MTSFADVYLPDSVRAYPWTGSVRTSSNIVIGGGGDEQRNKNWKHPLRIFNAPEAVRCDDDVNDLYEHFLVMDGPVVAFPMRDPLDFASRRHPSNTAPELFITDQVIGIGDGLTTSFQLSKTYTRGGRSYVRPIYFPILESVIFGMNALAITTANPTLPGGPYTADVVRIGGTVFFDHAPAAGIAITAGFLFDVPARFEADDSYDRMVVAYQTQGWASLSFQEVRFCNDGDSE